MSESVKVWMDSLANRTERTRELYLRYFKRFYTWAEKTPDELRTLKYQETQNRKPWQQSTVENLLRKYLAYMKSEENFKNVHLPYTAIRSFFKCNGLPLNLNGGDSPNSYNVQGSAVPSPEDIKAIVDSCEHIRDRLVVLFLKDSGLRTSDLEGLTWGMLKPMEEGYYGFSLTTKKRGVLARGFVGPETGRVLDLFRRKRLHGTRKVKPEQDLDNHPVFCRLDNGSVGIQAENITILLCHIFKAAGMREKDLSAHGLRKFWEQHVHAKKECYVKQLNGRALNSVEKAYNWLTPEQLFSIYKENYPGLQCMAPAQMIKQEDIERIVEERVQERTSHLEQQIDTLTKDLERQIVRANSILKFDLSDYEKHVEEMVKRYLKKSKP